MDYEVTEVRLMLDFTLSVPIFEAIAPFVDFESMRKPAVPLRKQTVTPYAFFYSYMPSFR